MGLFQRRQQQREKAERLAQGESIPAGSFDGNSRTRLLYAVIDCAPADVAGLSDPVGPFISIVRNILLREWGQMQLTASKGPPKEDFALFVISQSTEEELLDVIEATFGALEWVNQQRESWFRHQAEAEAFRSAVNRILDEHDIGYQVVGDKVVPRGSMVMYADVVEPSLSLLHGTPQLGNVERAFRDALRELKPGGSPGDAITDAARALQEMLSAAGAEGNTLGSLLASARKKELLGPYDTKLAEGVELIGEWVSADRSGRGDAHAERDPTADDAWLAVHVTGALIVRLAKRLSGPV